MRESGVIQNYALFGAAAQMRYTEPVATLDADVLVALTSPENLDLLRGIYEFCAARGFPVEGEAIRVARADHLAVITLSVGRAKDFARILALLESGSVSREASAGLAARHGLAEAWRRFESRFLDA